MKFNDVQKMVNSYSKHPNSLIKMATDYWFDRQHLDKYRRRDQDPQWHLKRLHNLNPKLDGIINGEELCLLLIQKIEEVYQVFELLFKAANLTCKTSIGETDLSDIEEVLFFREEVAQLEDLLSQLTNCSDEIHDRFIDMAQTLQKKLDHDKMIQKEKMIDQKIKLLKEN